MNSDPTFYISIASSVAFVISEILPFINNTEINGILHSLKVFLDNCKNPQVSDEVIEKMKNDITTIETKSDDFIINIKNDVNDIKNEVSNIQTDIKDIKNMFEQSEIV